MIIVAGIREGMRYYVIRDEDGRILYIHKIGDSAMTCFIALCVREDFVGEKVELVGIETDGFGKVVMERVMYMFIKGDLGYTDVRT